MSDTTTATSTPTVTVDPTTTQATPPAAAPSAPAARSADERDPAWVNERLERERAKLLKDLGVDSVSAAKKAVEAAKAADEANKSSADKAAEATAKLAAVEAEKAALAEALGVHAQSVLSGLTAEQQAAVKAIAGDNAAAQIKAVAALTPTWAKAAPAAAPTAPAPPADTAPPATAPNGTVVSPPDPQAVHAELLKTNPIVAARYAEANGLLKLK